jgi:hypothetical protein
VRLFRRYGKIPLHSEQERRPVPIVGDAAIAAAPIADGRLIPLLIIDTSDRDDLNELIRIHEHLPPGDVDFQWGVPPGSTDRVALVLSFKKPIETVAILEFDIVAQGILVEQILTAMVLYLQSGRPGDRLKTTPGASRIFVEVSDTGFRKHWDKIFLKRLTKEMKTKGLSNQQAKLAASTAIEEMRAIVQLRIKVE